MLALLFNNPGPSGFQFQVAWTTANGIILGTGIF